MAEKNDNRLITIVLAFIVIVAIFTYVYVNLPQDNNKVKNSENIDTNNDNNTNVSDREIILSIIFDSEEKNFTLSELEELEVYSGSGRYIKTKVLPDVIINGPYNFTGVKFTTLLSQMGDLPEKYNITVTASDGWTSTFTMNQINGEIDVYNETGNIIENGAVTMILAYKEDGEYINDEEVGPIQIAFVDDEVITASNLWSKMVESIEIIDL